MRRRIVAVVAVGAVLSGCGSGTDDGPVGETSGETTTSSAVAAGGDPWDVPLEQRPPLFDPCAEIPIDVLSEAGFSDDDRDPNVDRHRPNELMACSWSDGEVQMTVVASWMDSSQYKSDPNAIYAGEYRDRGRVGEKFLDKADAGDDTIRVAFFTARGAISLGVSSVSSLDSFRGEDFVDINRKYPIVSGPLLNSLPEGDYR